MEIRKQWQNPAFAYCILDVCCVIRSDDYPVNSAFTSILTRACNNLIGIWFNCVTPEKPHLGFLMLLFHSFATYLTFSCSRYIHFSCCTMNIFRIMLKSHNRFALVTDQMSTEVLMFADLNDLRSLFFLGRWLKKFLSITGVFFPYYQDAKWTSYNIALCAFVINSSPPPFCKLVRFQDVSFCYLTISEGYEVIGKVLVSRFLLMANIMCKYYLAWLPFYLCISLDFKLSSHNYHYSHNHKDFLQPSLWWSTWCWNTPSSESDPCNCWASPCRRRLPTPHTGWFSKRCIKWNSQRSTVEIWG